VAKTWDEDFSKIVNALNNLESAWSSAKNEGADTSPIEQNILRLYSEMTDEQLEVYGEYVKERSSQAERDVARIKELLAETEAELARRKNK
jgi:hypothetical protein